MKKMRKRIGKRIREIREQKGYTQGTVAQQLGISHQKLARIENGINDISYETIINLSKIFSVDPLEITKVSDGVCKEMRINECSTSTFSRVEDMINLFYANKSLYLQMTSGDNSNI